MRLRSMIAVLALGWLLVAGLAAAAPPALAPAPAAAPQAASPAEIDALVKTLEDPAARAALIEQLKILSAARQPPPGAPAGPGGLVARFLADVSAGIATVGGELADAAFALHDLRHVGAWLARQVRDPALLADWGILLAKLAIVLAAAALADWLADQATRGARERLDAARAEDPLGAPAMLRWGGLALRAIVGLVPIIAFIVVAYVALAVVQPDRVTRLVALAVIHANVLVRAILAVARLILMTPDARYRLLRLSEETSAYAYLWIRRLVSVAVYGFFLIEAGLLVGLPTSVHHVAMRILGLVAASMIVVLILQNRSGVADWLRGGPRGGPRGVEAAARRLSRRFAEIWHILAILYVAVVFLVAALGVPGGFVYLSRATALSILILVLGRVAGALLRHAIDRGFAVGADLTQRLPGLEARANRYLPVLSAVLQAAIYLIEAVALLQVWGADSFGFLASDLGRRAMSGVLSILVALTVAAIIWELLSVMIERYLGESGDGSPLRSARTRTLLPLLRHVSAIMIVVLVGLVVLSEIGIDITPLLAGASVVGLAIGFGAQTLVKDVITGFFIMIEDTINVGDVVQVDQRTGAVESISIRSIRIRDAEGAVYTVPFSAVSTVKNLTKDYSYYVLDIAVGQAAEPAAVTAVLRQVDEAIRADPQFQYDVLDPLDVQGVDKLVDGGMVIRARVRTRPGRQWTVGREFNRRIAAALAAAGVPGAMPVHAIQVIGQATGQAAAPPAPDLAGITALPKPAAEG
jgi:small conductance mechanosensitive channel